MIPENKRFFEIIEVLKEDGKLLDYVELAGILNTNKSGINDLKQGRKKLSLEIIRMMKKSYPDMSLDWLITGQGKMFEISSKLRETENEMKRITEPMELIDKLVSQAKEIGRLENEIKVLTDKLEKGNTGAGNSNGEDARGAGCAAVGL
jgi:hypothetical protein